MRVLSKISGLNQSSVNKYGEPTGEQTLDVMCGIVTIQARVHTWTVQPAQGDCSFCPLITGKLPVVGVAGRALAGRSPAGAGPPTPQAAGVPVSRDKSCNHLGVLSITVRTEETIVGKRGIRDGSKLHR